MSKEEILGGLKNAIAKGQTLQQAISSFKNAGYPEEDLRLALSEFNQKPTTPINSQTIHNSRIDSSQENTNDFRKSPQGGSSLPSKLNQQIKSAIVSKEVAKNGVIPSSVSLQKPNSLQPVSPRNFQKEDISSQTIQRVSNYEPNVLISQKNSQGVQKNIQGNKKTKVILITILAIIVPGSIIGTIIYREEITKFIGNLINNLF